ncbi:MULTISPECIES: glycosyltransferase [Microbacterium]|uniref:glycosyltransferase n=1 Tax=Microbacterium TaxID=33882 RepID=UPI0027883027|nr:MULTISPECIES: glycosyltransferase [Microbacterium]MDQ1075608.1 glycosyltransferase involved in cell wall biosynthesis [Microbacterium sp. SORGH_AS_0969]MDQ1115847.1 glycosyltransferase involved in cell wall biosynthesis [Microbacterium testaceum]
MSAGTRASDDGRRGLLVHEWIAPAGGSENVLEAMARAFPAADVQCLWTDAPDRLADRRVAETWLARTPLRRSKALAAPFCLPTWRTLRPRDIDWMLVSSHLFAHHARQRGAGDVAKYVYVHTPARYVWTPEFDPRGQGPAVRAVAPLFQAVDRRRAREPLAIAANSAFVRDRVAACWGRESVVIHPPVDVATIADVPRWEPDLTAAERRQLASLPRPFILGASRFTSYKRLDLVIDTADRLGIAAVLAGRGPDENSLRQRAARSRVPVTLVISPSDALLRALYRDASTLVFPAIEDFGIIPVEAQALGTPVVTGPLGGQVETYTDGVSGVTAASVDPADLADAARRALALPAFDGPATTARFSSDVFEERIRDFVSG